MGYRTAAVSVTVGTIFLVMGLEFAIVGFMYPSAMMVPDYIALPMVGAGLTATVLGYLLWYFHAKSNLSNVQ